MVEPREISYREALDRILAPVGLSYDPGKIISDKLTEDQVEIVRTGLRNLVDDIENGRLVIASRAFRPVPVYAFLGEYAKALQFIHTLSWGSLIRATALDVKLTLKYHLDMDVEASDLLNRFRVNFLNWGNSNISEPCLLAHIDELIRSLRARYGHNLLSYLSKTIAEAFEENPDRTAEDHFGLLVPIEGVSGNGFGSIIYRFGGLIETLVDIKERVRSLENAEREKRGVPRIGEGWIEETDLYNKIKRHFSDLTVLHHDSPSWLGSQHLDIYIPEIKMAVEYQGIQHQRPVGYFGGNKAFKAQQRRDRQKKALCEQNGVLLMGIEQGYVLSDLIKTIQERRNSMSQCLPDETTNVDEHAF